MNDPDYVVIGGGSAGCVLAARLSEDPSLHILLLEAGPEGGSPWLYIPIGFGRTRLNPKFDWCYPAAGNVPGATVQWPRGRVLGGSGAINGLMYVRGQAADYDHWRQLGNVGWSFADVEPYFRRSETRLDRPHPDRGDGGPLAVSDGRYHSKLADLFVQAAQAVGLPFNEDYNGRRQEGVAYAQYTTRNGWRASTASDYLGPARQRPNLRVQTGAMVERIELDGARAVAVHYRDATGAQRVVARREIVLAAGSIASPHLLQLSGIGPADVLKKAGIAVAHDLPGVGRNLQDHFHTRIEYDLSQPISLNDGFATLGGRVGAALRYALLRRGPLAMGASPAHAFVRVGARADTPDIQLLCFPYTADSSGRSLQRRSAFSLAVCSLRPESRGTVAVVGPKAEFPPAITPNFLATDYDRETLVAGMRMARRVAAAAPLAQVIAAEAKPGPVVDDIEGLLDHARRNGGTSYHPVGTCKMGVDAMAVCDPQLRVRGIANLRIADASVMPTLTSGNTNAPTIMIAEKATDLIRAA